MRWEWQEEEEDDDEVINSYWDKLPLELKTIITSMSILMHVEERLAAFPLSVKDDLKIYIRQAFQFPITLKCVAQDKTNKQYFEMGSWKAVNMLFNPCKKCNLFFKHYARKINDKGDICTIGLTFYNQESVPFTAVEKKRDSIRRRCEPALYKSHNWHFVNWFHRSCADLYLAKHHLKSYYCVRCGMTHDPECDRVKFRHFGSKYSGLPFCDQYNHVLRYVI